MSSKALVILLSLLALAAKLPAQEFKFIPLKEDFLLYKGAYLKLVKDPFGGFDRCFYSDLKYCQSKYDNNVIYPSARSKVETSHDSLANRIFKVENIIDKHGNPLNKNSDPVLLLNPIFVLRDTANSQIIYYIYNTSLLYQFSTYFPFYSSKIKYTEEHLCSKLDRDVDDFTNTIRLSTPTLKTSQSGRVSANKYIDKGKISYYLYLKAHGNTVNVRINGVIVLFTDGTKWTNNAKVDVEVGDDGFEYSSFISLTSADLAVFSTKRIKKYRLYIYDEVVEDEDSEKFQLYIKCLKKAK